MLACAACGNSVSWPVASERLRRGERPSGAPEPGVLRVVTDSTMMPTYVTALASARLDTTNNIKMARTCPDGHFVARARTLPHAPPHHVEFPSDAVTLRLLDEQ